MKREMAYFLLGGVVSMSLHTMWSETTTLRAQSADAPVTQALPKRVTGVGGVFFKSEDPESLRAWYSTHLGLVTNEYGSMFEFRLADAPDQPGYLQWSPFSNSTTYFEPSEKAFMINYRVAHLEWLIDQLKLEDVPILDEI